jgi:hypothetical protein
MPDYQKGKIYKLWSPQGTEEEVYYGSTIEDLRKRKSKHKYSKVCKSNILFEKYDDVRIEVIEEYPCNSKAELNKKEGEYIRNNKCLNKRIEGRTKKEYQKEYNEINKEKIAERKKKYNEINKEKIAETKKKYKEQNKEYLKEKNKEYREKNKEYLKEKITCECGCLIRKSNLSIHQKTPKHIKLMEEKNNNI